ncbi:MAG: MFS transporter [Pseudonocardiaceae bacterium]
MAPTSVTARVETAAPQTWAPFGPTVAVLAATGVLVVGQMYTVIALFVPMATTFGAPAGQLTWMATAFGFAYAVGFLFAGPLSDRYGPRTIITIGLLATTVTTALVAFAGTLTLGCALRALQGVTAACFAPAAFSYVTEHINPKRRALALTCITSGFLAAAVLMQVAAQVVSAAVNWQTVFLISSPCMLLAALANRAVLRPNHREQVASVASAFAAMPKLLARPKMLALYAATMTLLGGFVAIYTAVTLAGPSSVAGHPSALLALRASALPAMVVIPLVTPLLARVPAVPRIAASLSVAAVAALAAAASGGNVIVLGAVLLVFVAAIAAAAPALVEAIGAAAGTARGAAVALYAFAMFVGASLGPQLAGALASWGFAGIVRVVAVVLAVGALLALATVRSRRASEIDAG